MGKSIMRRLKIIPVIIMCASAALYAYSDQTTSERIIKENTHFIEFINVCISNFKGAKKQRFKKLYEEHLKTIKKQKLFDAKSDKDKKQIDKEYNESLNNVDYKNGNYIRALFKRSYNKHFNAEVAYLQSDYKRAFKGIYSSQSDLSKLFEGVLFHLYLEDAKQILDNMAPEIIKSKNARARLYLTLGYRDRTVSWTHYQIGEASNPRLYSYKIYQYEEAIKVARRAKRYAFLALFEAQDKKTKRLIYHHLLDDELKKNKKSMFYKRFIGLDDKKFMEELNKPYDVYIKQQKQKGTQTNTFEKKVEKRVRFRNEAQAGRYLLRHEFDRAEDVLRKYVKDFNFKLINSTLEYLTEEKKKKNKTGGVDYTTYKVHLLDNYTRMANKSLLSKVLDEVRVVDAVKKNSDNTGNKNNKNNNSTADNKNKTGKNDK